MLQIFYLKLIRYLSLVIDGGNKWAVPGKGEALGTG